MKVDIDLEELENGWILTLNGKRYACSSPLQIQRRIMAVILQKGKPSESVEDRYGLHAKRMKEFWKDKIGGLEKSILELVESKGFGTVEDLAEALKGRYKQPLWQVRGQIKVRLQRLAQKGYVERFSPKSKKYRLTEKRPRAYIETGKKVNNIKGETDVKG